MNLRAIEVLSMNMTRKERLVSAGFMLPSFMGVFILFLLPFLLSIFTSFFMGAGNTKFVGIDNYISLFQSSSFRLAVWNTVKFMFTGIPMLFFSAMALALLCDYLYRQKFWGYHFWFVLSLLPMITPTSAVIFFFRVLFEDKGSINGLLVAMGQQPIRWLNSEWGFWVLILLFLWKNTSYCMVLLLAGMRSIGKGTVEAASIDGAGPWKTFWKIRLPQIRPFLFFTLLIAVMSVFKVYRESYHLVGEYPHNSMYMLQNFMNNNFYKLNTQRLSVASIVFFAAVSGGLYLLFRQSARENENDV